MSEKESLFSTQYTVSISDINYGNHMGNDRFLSLAHEVRLRFLASHGQTELDFFGTQLILTEADLKFKTQVFHGDTLDISVTVSEKKKVSFTLCYTVTRWNEERSKADLIAVIHTKMACFDYETNRLTSIPDSYSL